MYIGILLLSLREKKKSYFFPHEHSLQLTFASSVRWEMMQFLDSRTEQNQSRAMKLVIKQNGIFIF